MQEYNIITFSVILSMNFILLFCSLFKLSNDGNCNFKNPNGYLEIIFLIIFFILCVFWSTKLKYYFLFPITLIFLVLTINFPTNDFIFNNLMKDEIKNCYFSKFTNCENITTICKYYPKCLDDDICEYLK